MRNSVYELISMGFRYWFVFLVILALWRAVLIMRRDRREYKRTLRQLPDAGLVGELVDLESGRGHPLAREGIIGSGRSCDIRLEGLRRREFEFFFRPGHGLRLIPVHRNAGATLDGEEMNMSPCYALHGTVLAAKGTTCRFRLFSGLNLPARAASSALPHRFEEEEQGGEFLTSPELTPPDMEMTWQYAAFPPQADQAEEETQLPYPVSRRQRRAARRKHHDEA